MTPNQATELLRPHVEALKADAQAGVPEALRLVDTYMVLTKRPEGPAGVFVSAALREWLESKAPTTETT